jgi:NAD(P)-dependent dehydrogenase (short-subunit alcohol dehydrogenase family)
MDLYVVTGASRGLGFALATQLSARSDARVVTISRAGFAGATWRDIRADLGTEAGQNAAIGAIVSALGSEPWSRAVLINNAGTVEPLAVVGEADAASVRRNIAVNLTAAIVLMDAFIGNSSRIAKRSVINISSGSGRRPIAGTGSYCAAKAGMDMISRVAALEAETAGAPITVTSLAPGIIDTDMQVTARSATEKALPSVAMFRTFKADNMLKTADEVAARIIALERSGKLPAGIADVREL